MGTKPRRILKGPALAASETADMLGYDETDIPSLVRQGILTPVIEGRRCSTGRRWDASNGNRMSGRRVCPNTTGQVIF